ncbi:MAG: preprotein translocase subunit YajC [Bacteroidetes bacterium]|jgi:preprotein translocase subunit YajC|nr:MAG: preprotein translocase subunit YajC [Bacteroidota bacterium]
MSSFVFLAMAAPGGDTNPIAMFLPLVLIFIVFYIFIIRPQKKKEDTRKKMIEAVKKNNRVITIGGVHGTVTQVDETSVLVQVDNNTKLRIEKSALSSVVGKESGS